MYHLTDDGPKKCSTTPDKCPIQKKNPDAKHYENINDAYKAYEDKNITGQLTKPLAKPRGYKQVGFELF